MRRVLSTLLALLAGILFPVLIWVGLFVAIRPGLVRVASKARGVALALAAAMFVPLLIWIGLFVALKEWVHEWQLQRAPSRTITDIMQAAGLNLQSVPISEEPVADIRFVPRSISEIHDIFARAGLV